MHSDKRVFWFPNLWFTVEKSCMGGSWSTRVVKKDVGKFSFLKRMVREWNQLDQEILEAESSTDFRNRLRNDSLRRPTMDGDNYRQDLNMWSKIHRIHLPFNIYLYTYVFHSLKILYCIEVITLNSTSFPRHRLMTINTLHNGLVFLISNWLGNLIRGFIRFTVQHLISHLR